MKRSAGILFFKRRPTLQVLLVHPGGPFWKNKDLGIWSVPKGEPGEGEDLLDVAIREVKEELGVEPSGNFIPLEPVRQNPSKTVYVWALEMDVDVLKIVSNEFEMEWPPGSGKMLAVPEVDRAEWFEIPVARQKILPGQKRLLEQLMALMK